MMRYTVESVTFAINGPLHKRVYGRCGNLKNPNGAGTVVYLGKRRRNPYAVKVTVKIDENGKQIRKYIGYYPTRKEANIALAEHFKHPSRANDITIAELHRFWTEWKYPNLTERSQMAYNTEFKRCVELHDKRINDITPMDIQRLIDGSRRSKSTQERIKSYFSMMYDFAILNSWTDFNPASSVHLYEPEHKAPTHMRFSKEEMEKLWAHSDNYNVQVVLCMIYSGARPGEFLSLKKEQVHDDFFVILDGKNKYAARKVPIHEKVKPFYARLMQTEGLFLATDNGKPYDFTKQNARFKRKVWIPALLEAECLQYEIDGELHEHKPHDVRHTFTSMWTEQGLNEIYRRAIQGHTGKGVGERVYTHLTIEDLGKEMNRLL